MARRNQALVIGLIVGGAALAAFLVVSAAVAVLVLRDGKSAGTTAANTSAKMTRDEFKAAYMGKTKDEVLKALGKPHRTNQNAEDSWTYQGRYTYDPISGRNDSSLVMWFNSAGLVQNIAFY